MNIKQGIYKLGELQELRETSEIYLYLGQKIITSIILYQDFVQSYLLAPKKYLRAGQQVYKGNPFLISNMKR